MRGIFLLRFRTACVRHWVRQMTVGVPTDVEPTAASEMRPARRKRVSPAAVTDETRERNQRGVLDFLDPSGGAGPSSVGRAWRVEELRAKSFEDLHRVWFLCLKERNVLETEREWCRANRRHWVGGQSKLVKLKDTMARIQTVVGERARQYRTIREQMDQRAGNQGLGALDYNVGWRLPSYRRNDAALAELLENPPETWPGFTETINVQKSPENLSSE
mmetsp:Transcript_4785/g.9674  ORF Transcript_4785/g.9674 Transcript_4785/m.9674 type:complete len:218 (-) Transcript_4785:3103-3756(-)